MKEGMHWELKLIENWIDDCSIVGVIDVDRMVRKDDFGEIKKWIYHPNRKLFVAVEQGSRKWVISW